MGRRGQKVVFAGDRRFFEAPIAAAHLIKKMPTVSAFKSN
jgi:hypothetical protein